MPPYRQQPPQPLPQQGGPSAYPPPSQSPPLSGMDEAFPPYRIVDASALGPNLGSTYIPLDSWIYPELMRLYSLGYLDRAFVDMRPWTRISVLRMLYAEQERIHMERNNEEALAIYDAVMAELEPDTETAGGWQIHSTLASV